MKCQIQLTLDRPKRITIFLVVLPIDQSSSSSLRLPPLQLILLPLLQPRHLHLPLPHGPGPKLLLQPFHQRHNLILARTKHENTPRG